MSESNVNDNNLIRISLFESDNGFQNPNFTDSFNIETPNLIIDNSKQTKSFSNDQFVSKNRSVILKDLDIICCKKIFTIKAKTYSNFRRCIQMLIPFGVLIALVLILIVLFRVDVFVQNEEKFDD